MIFTVENANTNKLHTELVNANLKPDLVTMDNYDDESRIAELTTIQYDQPVDEMLVQSIIDSHDPKPQPSPPTELEKIKGELATIQGALDFIIMNY